MARITMKSTPTNTVEELYPSLYVAAKVTYIGIPIPLETETFVHFVSLLSK